MMKRRWMEAVFAPRAVAVIGSCGNPSKLAWGTLRATLQSQQERPVVAIDPHANSQQPYPAFLHPQDVPTHFASCIDLAVVVSPRHECLERMKQCIDSFPALAAVNVVSGGFRETPGGNDLELKLVETARDSGIRLIGPNSVGSIDTFHKFASMFLRTFPRPGNVSFLSQSGGMCGAVVELLHQKNMGLSKVLSLGNAADVGFVDALEAVGDDPNTHVVMLYVEGLGPNDYNFVPTAKALAVDKPIIAVKGGISQDAARAVTSHSGALAGNTKVWEAALREAGIVQATSLNGMLEMAHAFSCRPRVTTQPCIDNKYRVAVITNAGGPAAQTVDALITSGAATVPELSESLQNEIRSHVDIHALSSTANPIDLLGAASPQGYKSAVEAVTKSPNVDAVVALHVPMALSQPKRLAEELTLVASPSKQVVGMFVTSDVEFMRPFSSVLYSESIPTFASADGVANAFRAWKQREDLVFSRLGKEETQQESVELSNVQLTQCHDYLSCKGSGWVLEHEARTLLDILGIRQPKAELVSTGSSLKDVVEAAEMIGFPVALKRVDHVHKAKAGGVALDLHNPAQVQAAFEKMCLSMDSSSITTAPMLVCEYISTAFLREFLIGIVHDETFGPAICFGSGGSFVEAMDDVAFALPPQTRLDTLELVRRSKLAMSEPQLDLSVIADAVERIAALAKAFPNIAELDVNPVMVGLYDQGETRLQAADIKFRLDG